MVKQGTVSPQTPKPKVHNQQSIFLASRKFQWSAKRLPLNQTKGLCHLPFPYCSPPLVWNFYAHWFKLSFVQQIALCKHVYTGSSIHLFHGLGKLQTKLFLVRSLSVFIVTGRMQAPIFACSLFLTYEINLAVDPSENFFSPSSKKAWKINVICINSKWRRQGCKVKQLQFRRA